MKYFLSIAASDPSGGAGIQQDLKVAKYYGFWGLSVVTALTVQDFNKVYAIYPVENKILEDQLKCIFKAFTPDCIKIGLITDIEQLDLLSFYLNKYKPFTVLDPVFKSSSGFDFIKKDYIDHLKTCLLNQIDIITPNCNELSLLLEENISDYKEALIATKDFAKHYRCQFYLKGGHFSDQQIKEAFVSSNVVIEFLHPRKSWKYAHGTGCAFSSALAINQIIHHDIKKALHESHRYVDEFYEAQNGLSNLQSFN